MLGRLKSILRNWLLTEPPKPPSTIEVQLDGEFQRVVVIGAIGMCLQVRTSTGSTRVIGMQQAVHREDFWDAWEYYSQGELTWEDGTPFERP